MTHRRDCPCEAVQCECANVAISAEDLGCVDRGQHWSNVTAKSVFRYRHHLDSCNAQATMNTAKPLSRRQLGGASCGVRVLLLIACLAAAAMVPADASRRELQQSGKSGGPPYLPHRVSSLQKFLPQNLVPSGPHVHHPAVASFLNRKGRLSRPQRAI